MKDIKHYKSKLSKEGQKAYEILLRGLTNHQDIIVIPTTMPPEKAYSVAEAVDFDNPQLYFVNFHDLEFISLDEPGTLRCWGVIGAYYMNEEECKRIDSIMTDEIREVLSESLKETSFENRYWKLYNWLLKRCSTGWCKDFEEYFPNAASSLIGPLLLDETMCEGYAKAFKLLCDQLNEMLPANQRYECIVSAEYDDTDSENSLGHAWNTIIVNDQEWLHCDLAKEPDDEERHGRYFMISEEELRRKWMIDDNPEMITTVHTQQEIKEYNNPDNPVVINGNIFINGDINITFNSFGVEKRRAYPSDAIMVEAVDVEEL